MILSLRYIPEGTFKNMNHEKEKEMKKRVFFVIGCVLFYFISCNTQKKINIDYGLYTDYVMLDRYEIIDSITVDSMINRSIREHYKITGFNASFFDICYYQDGVGNYNYNIVSCSTYDGMNQGNDIERTYSFSYYKGRILLLARNCIPSKLFKPTGEKAYVMLMSGGSDLTNCVFDSTYHFIKSENAIVEVR